MLWPPSPGRGGVRGGVIARHDIKEARQITHVAEPKNN